VNLGVRVVLGSVCAESPSEENAAFEAGVYDGMPEHVYHGDPVPGGSLSSSGARKLLPPSCPARFRHDLDHPPLSTPNMERGTAAHRLVLGTGAEITEVDAPDWRTKAAQEKRDKARADGKVPLLAAEYRKVRDMAAALRAHPLASALFNPDSGRAEQSLFWQDALTGIWRRARLDWMPDADARERLIAVDYKTTTSADPDGIAKSVYTFGYYMQAPWYLDGLQALGLAEDPAFVFVFQETAPPYLVNAIQLDWLALRTGYDRNRRAIERYRDCMNSGIWPGYTPDIRDLPTISLPHWAARHLDEEAEAA
jgi:PDDEXK-like domain of unknown function (DUF3799)